MSELIRVLAKGPLKTLDLTEEQIQELNALMDYGVVYSNCNQGNDMHSQAMNHPSIYITKTSHHPQSKL